MYFLQQALTRIIFSVVIEDNAIPQGKLSGKR